MSYATQPTTLGFVLELPQGWSYSGGVNEPAIRPFVGATGTLDWIYLDGFGSGSSLFTFTLNYPAGLSGSQTISASAVYRTPLSNLSIAPLVLTAAALDSAPTFNVHPANQSVAAGDSANFSAAVTGTPTPGLQWQVSTNSGGTWENLSNTAPYSGVTTETLTITGAALDHNGTFYRALASNTAQNNVPSNAASLTVQTRFAAWQTAQFTTAELLNTAISGPYAIYGFDGITNLVKYALGLESKAEAVSGLPKVTNSGADWDFTYTRPSATTDIACAVEISTDLITWTTSGVVHEMASSTSGIETWRGRVPVTDTPRIFFRLRVTQN